MGGSAIYGFFLGIGAILLIQAAPQPIGSIVWWGFFAGHLGWAAGVCWRRTGLPNATAAMGIAAMTSGVLAALAAAGHVFPDLPIRWWVSVSAGFVSVPLLLLVESRIHQAKWRRWKEHMRPMHGWEILSVRHIPYLRNDGA